MSDYNSQNSSVLLDRANPLSRVNLNKKSRKGSYLKNQELSAIIGAVADSEASKTLATLVIIDQINNLINKRGLRPPQWRDLDCRNLAFFHHLGLRHLSEESNGELQPYPFTFNLTPELIKECSEDASFSGRIQRALKKALEYHLERKVDFYFVVEVEPKGARGRPHLHGEVLVSNDECNKRLRINEKTGKADRSLRAAFHSLNSYLVAEFKKHSILIKKSKADFGWPSYLSKAIAYSGLHCSGKPLAKTRGCSSSAIELYTNHVIRRCLVV